MLDNLNKIKGSVKGMKKEEEIWVDKIESLERCLRNKDRRLTIIERRYKNIIWCFASVGIIALFGLFTYLWYRVLLIIPDPIVRDSYGVVLFLKSNLLILFGVPVVVILSYIGFCALIWWLYLIVKECYKEE